MRLDIVGQREPGLGAVRLWKKSLPFLPSLLGIYFVFVDFVFFAQSRSLLIGNKDKREVVPQKKPVLWFHDSFGHKRTWSGMVSLLEISSKWHQCLNLKIVGSHYFGNLLKPGICSAHIFYPLGAWKLDCWGSYLFLSLDAWNLLDCNVFFDHRRPQNRLHEVSRHWLFTWEQISCLWDKSSRRKIFRFVAFFIYVLFTQERRNVCNLSLPLLGMRQYLCKETPGMEKLQP